MSHVKPQIKPSFDLAYEGLKGLKTPLVVEECVGFCREIDSDNQRPLLSPPDLGLI